MQQTLALLTKKAIDSALHSDWKSAVELNLQIIERDPENVDAKIRLGRAYNQTKEFNKAKRIFREILKKDPINSIAKKNLELANKNKADTKTNGVINTKSLLMEPSKCTEQTIQITAKGVTSRDFHPGEELLLKIKKRAVDVILIKKLGKVTVGSIEDKNIVQRAKDSTEREGCLSATFLKGNGKEITLMIKASLPVFKADKQEIRPYIKKGSFDEPELEIEEAEETPEE